MDKTDIVCISNIDNLSAKQFKSICDYISLANYGNTFPLSVLEKESSIIGEFKKELKEQSLKGEAKDKQKKRKNASISIRFRFDRSSKFICLENKLLPSQHCLVLPEVIASQFGIESILFRDNKKLLVQVGAIHDIDNILLLPWEILGTQQMVSVAKLYGVRISTIQVLKHGSTLTSYLKGLCTNSNAFTEKCDSKDTFDQLLFSFSMSDIFNCNFVCSKHRQESSELTVIIAAHNINLKGVSRKVIF